MKKLIFIALFTVGMFSFANAQFLTYNLTNSSSTQTWDYKMTDAGSGVVTTELGITPGTNRSGVVSGFGFPLTFKAANGLGCGTTQTVPAPTPGVSVPIICVVPAGLKYKVDVVVPFLVWHLELKFG